MGDASSGSLLSSKRLAVVLPGVGRVCGLSTSRSSSSSNKRSNREVKAGRASSNARQPDMVE